MDPPDFEKLESFFGALSYSARLELLHILRIPRAAADIRLTSRYRVEGEAPRSISRQAIQEHLDRLLAVGLVVAREPPSGKGPREYVVNSQRLYQVMDEFWRVGSVFGGTTAPGGGTQELGAMRAGPMEQGPQLVLVHGALEGKAFPLRRTDLQGERGWIVGRKRGLHVSLEYDPYVSLENCEIVPRGADHVLIDLRSSRNGTWLNWRPLADGEQARLRPGDVLGVGRSLLVFRSE